MPNKKFDVKIVAFGEVKESNRIEIPKFQRNYIWPKDKKQDLLISIKNGFPIGSITVFEKNDKWYLIDGLQRISTITEFIEKPSNIYSFNILKNKTTILNELIGFINSNFANSDKVISAVRKWYTNNFDNKLYSFTNFKNNYIMDLVDDEELVEELHAECKKSFSIEKIQIPFIVYKGNWDEVAEIFMYINSGSITLTKYEVYAAIWYKYNVVNVPQKYCDLIELKYSELANDMVIDSKDTESNYNILELMNAFSKELVDLDKERKVIKSTKKIQRLESELYFDLFSTLFRYSPGKMETLMKELYNSENEDLITKFVVEIQSRLLHFTQWMINRFDNEQIKYYHQYLYVLTSWMHIYFCIDIKKLSIEQRKEPNIELFNLVADVNMQNEDEWFKGDNRQITFLSSKTQIVYEQANNIKENNCYIT